MSESDRPPQLAAPAEHSSPGNGSPNRNHWPVRPLTRTRRDNGSLYTREPGVESQIVSLSRMSDRARRERLLNPMQRSAAWEDDARLREETLVYFIRECSLRGEADTAWNLVETLIERVSLHVQRRLARWRLTPEDADDCARDLFAELCESLFDTSPTAEFWEVRFWVCLDRKLYNLIEKRQRTDDSEVSPGDTPDSDDERDSDRLLSQMVDPAARPDELAEFAEARSVLNQNEYMAVYLVVYLGYPEESEDPDRETAARVMGVTGRSVRNYLKRAKQKLRDWYAEKGPF